MLLGKKPGLFLLPLRVLSSSRDQRCTCDVTWAAHYQSGVRSYGLLHPAPSCLCFPSVFPPKAKAKAKEAVLGGAHTHTCHPLPMV